MGAEVHLPPPQVGGEEEAAPRHHPGQGDPEAQGVLKVGADLQEEALDAGVEVLLGGVGPLLAPGHLPLPVQGHEDRALHAHLRAQGHPGPGPEPEEGGRPAQWGGRGGPLLQKPLLEQLLHEAAHGALGEACGPGQVGAGEGAPPELVQDGPAVEPAEGLDVALTLRALLSSFPGLTKARAPQGVKGVYWEARREGRNGWESR